MIKLPYLSNNKIKDDFWTKILESSTIDISPEELSYFFNFEANSLLRRLKKLKEIGGISGLQNILQMNTKVH
jgi:hypothetical protein